ncbi:MAG TPA: GNAT family protein [Thermoanaerobaculia bacterium]|nr:GNAT family protein [Thermoanaerobaculia bacterium]
MSESEASLPLEPSQPAEPHPENTEPKQAVPQTGPKQTEQKQTEQKQTQPRRIAVEGLELELREMAAADRDRMVEFARSLPWHDLLFLRREITEPRAVDAWIRDIENGHVVTLLALDGDEAGSALAGYATLHRNELRWSAHVGELRVLIAPPYRGRGLGRALTQQIFRLALERGIEKMMARMTVDQKGAIATFEGLGFKPEAVMRDHVKDAEGNPHDLVVMALSVADFHRTLDSYGVTEAIGGSIGG